MRIGVFGGTFDPVHCGHLVVAEAAARELTLDQVRLIPTSIQPFKQDLPVTDARHRLAMLSAAVLGHDLLLVDDREVVRGGVSYTADTLESLHADFPDDQLFLMVGADACRGLPSWHRAERVAELCTVVELTRPGAPSTDYADRQVEVPVIDVSSTEVREAVRTGQTFERSVPAAVADYIREHALYR